jgi:hypothetical protein
MTTQSPKASLFPRRPLSLRQHGPCLTSLMLLTEKGLSGTMLALLQLTLNPAAILQF